MTRPIAFSQAALRPLKDHGGSLQWKDVHEPNEPVTGCIDPLKMGSSRLNKGWKGREILTEKGGKI